MTLSTMILFSSLLSVLPVNKADAATIFINNTASVGYTDNFGGVFVPSTDTAAINVLNPPMFGSFAMLGDPFSPNADSRADTLYISYSLYDHDYAQDTVSLLIYAAGDTVAKTFASNEAQDTGTLFNYAWDGRDDTGTALADGIYKYLLTAANTDGNTSTMSGTVTLDITPPSGSMFINDSATYVNTRTVYITMPAYDNLSGVDTVVISNTSSFASAETRAYSIRQPWILSNDTEPVRTVYLRYYDRAWNASATYSDSIILDAVPPSVIFTSPYDGETDVPKIAVVTAVFNDIMDTSTLNSATFILRSSHNETVIGAISSQISGNTSSVTLASSTALRSAETYTATITTGVKDKAGNSMAAPKSWKFMTISYDIMPPTGTILVNTGALYTNTTTVTLRLTAYDAQSPVTTMFVSNSTFNNASSFAYGETLIWALDPAEGLKKVTVWFEDDAFNLSWPYSDTITLDMTPPGVLWTVPAESQANVHTDLSVRVAFNDTLDTSTINTSAFVFTDSLGSTIPVSITYRAFTNTSVITITPNFYLTAFETYTVTVNAGIRDKSGLSMGMIKSWSFVTGDFVAPAAVEPIKTAQLSATSAEIVWKPVTKNMDGTAFADGDSYVIMRGTSSGGPYYKLGEVNAGDTSYTDTSTPGVIYYYVIRAQDTSGNSSPYWIEVTNTGDVIYRIPRDNSRGTNEEISLDIGISSITVKNPDVNDMFTKIYIPKEASPALYRNTNAYGDDVGIYILRSASEEGQRTRNLGTVISCYEGIPYSVTNTQHVPGFRFASKATLTMRYEVEGGFIKHTNIPAALADKNLSISYWNGIQWVRMGGTVNMSRQTISVATGFLGKFAITAIDVSRFRILSAEPNPFTPHRAPFDKVVFSLVNPDNERVALKIYDLTGAIVYNNEYPAGTVNFEWNGADRTGRPVEDGVYIYQVQAGDKAYTGTIILAK